MQSGGFFHTVVIIADKDSAATSHPPSLLTPDGDGIRSRVDRRRGLLLPLHHAVRHEVAVERPVHPFERDNLANRLVPDARSLEHHGPWVPDADPDGVPPRPNGVLHPVGAAHGRHLIGTLHQPAVLLDGHEVRVRPLLVQKLEVLLLLRGERRRCLALAPGGDDDRTPRLEHADHLLDVLLLVRHVLAGLARPHQVEGVVREVHRQRVHHLERRVWQVLLRRQLGGALDLVRGQGDALHLGVGPEALGEVPGGAADAAPDVEHPGGFRRAFRPFQHLIDKVELGLDEILHVAAEQGARTFGHVLVGVPPEVDVFAPVVLEDAFLGPRVVLLADGADAAVLGPGDVRPGWPIEDVLQRERAGREREGAAGGVGNGEARDGRRGVLRGSRDDRGFLSGELRHLVGAVGPEHRRREVGDGEVIGAIGVGRAGGRRPGERDGARAADGPGGGRRADPGGPAEQRVSGAQRLHDGAR